MLIDPKSWLDLLFWVVGAVALVLAHIYPRFADIHYSIAIALLLVGSIRLLRRLRA